MTRRQFLEGVLGGSATAMVTSFSCGPGGNSDLKAIPRRTLGRTGEKLSIIGFGGIVVMNEEQSVANDHVAKAFDRGINYFDVAPTYGNAQDKLGPALKPYRDRCFLACKTTQREKAGAEKELHESLEKMQTDFFDLYQLHAITTREDVETAFGPGGAMEVFLKAKEEGKVRFLGFSAHSEEAALLAMEKFEFDTTLFPINYVCWQEGHFGAAVVARAKEKQMGILALKALASTQIADGQEKPVEKCWYVPNTDESLQGLALRWTLSQGTTAAIPPGEPVLFWRAVELAARAGESLSPTEEESLESSAKVLTPLFSTV